MWSTNLKVDKSDSLPTRQQELRSMGAVADGPPTYEHQLHLLSRLRWHAGWGLWKPPWYLSHAPHVMHFCEQIQLGVKVPDWTWKMSTLLGLDKSTYTENCTFSTNMQFSPKNLILRTSVAKFGAKIYALVSNFLLFGSMYITQIEIVTYTIYHTIYAVLSQK